MGVAPGLFGDFGDFGDFGVLGFDDSNFLSTSPSPAFSACSMVVCS